MKNIKKKPELLAPAGNLDSAIAAFQNGADAVYAGISRFNAREMGENFSWDDMSRLSAYTKKNNKRFYLTLNTLIKENEIKELGNSVELISKLSPDAIIVQDLGVIRFLRQYFPEITIHASTQMGIHNSYGVKTAATMGISRVILERQITTEELTQICKQPVEIEVFIHGALCCSISGHCLFSSWLGGWSGNRGRCKQPCRRRFYGEKEGKKQSGFFFSTQDFYCLDMLDTLSEAGVCSLKIEGRLKKPDYVKSVVKAYRIMLDSPIPDKAKNLKEARLILASSYGRKWSHGFSSTEDMQSLIQYKSAGVSGRLVGSIEKTSKSGFEISVIQRLHLGDRIRIQPKTGDEGPSITITKITNKRQSVRSATKGDRVFIHCDKSVLEKSLVYKIGDTSMETVKRPAKLPLHKPPIKVQLSIKVTNSGVGVSARLTDSITYNWENNDVIEESSNCPLEVQNITEAFAVTRSDAIKTENIKVSIETPAEWKGLFIPSGKLKQIRRTFWEWFTLQPKIKKAIELQISDNFTETQNNSWLNTLQNDIEKNKNINNKKAENAVLGKTEKVCIKVQGIEDFLNNPENNTSEVILPFFCPEDRIPLLSSYIKKAYDLGIKRYRITSIYQISLIKDVLKKENELHKDLYLSSSFPLPAANSLAAQELKFLGLNRVQIWLELDKEAIRAAAENWPVTSEIYKRGKPFLLATRADISVEGKIVDARGKHFIVKKPPVNYLDFSDKNQLSFIFPDEVLVLPEMKNCAEYHDTSFIKNNEKESSFNYDFILV